jgi:protein TonB
VSTISFFSHLPASQPRVLAMALVSLALHTLVLAALHAPAWSVPARVALATIEVSFAETVAHVRATTARATAAPTVAVATNTTAEPMPAPSSSAAAASDEPYVEARSDVVGLDNPKPAYPLAARRRGLEGRVLLAAHVRADGACAEVQLKQSSGHTLLDQTALDTVRRWRFVPASRGARAVDSWVDVPIRFRLDS